MHERARNAPIAMDLAAADAAICPTDFQAAQFPPVFRRPLSVLHDGIDTGYFRPDARPLHSTLGGLVAEDARVVTYATRGMEPHRGFPQFMAAVAGDPRRSRGRSPSSPATTGSPTAATPLRQVDWKARALAEDDIDPARVHFVGHLGSARLSARCCSGPTPTST